MAIRVPTSRGPEHYDIEHTTATHLLDRQGALRERLPPGLLALGGPREIEAILVSGT